MNTMTPPRAAGITDAIIRHADLTTVEVEALRALQRLARCGRSEDNEPMTPAERVAALGDLDSRRSNDRV